MPANVPQNGSAKKSKVWGTERPGQRASSGTAYNAPGEKGGGIVNGGGKHEKSPHLPRQHAGFSYSSPVETTSTNSLVSRRLIDETEQPQWYLSAVTSLYVVQRQPGILYFLYLAGILVFTPHLKDNRVIHHEISL